MRQLQYHLALIEYDAVIWDPYLQQDIDRRDRVLHQFKVCNLSLVTTNPASQDVLPVCLSVKTFLHSKKEESIFVLLSCIDWLKGRYQLSILRTIQHHNDRSIQFV